MSTLRTLLAAERRRQRGRLLMAAGCSVGVATAAVLLLGLSGWFITAAGLAGAGTAAGSFNYLLPSAGIRLLAILRTAGRYGERISGHDAALRALSRVRPALFRAFAAMPASAALAISAGEAVARVTQDVAEIEGGFVRRSAVWGAAAALLAGLVLLSLAGAAAAGAMLAVVLGLYAGAYWLASVSETHGAAVANANGALKQDVAMLMAAAPELRAYGLEDWAAAHTAERSRTLVQAQQHAANASAWFEPMQAASGGLAATLVLALADGASLPLAALAALATMVVFEQIGAHLRGQQRSGHLGAAERRLNALLTQAGQAREPIVAIGRYPGIEFPKLREPGLREYWAAGNVIGVTGPSGCGKTTLVDRLTGLRPARFGEIRLGGHDVTALDPGQLRCCFSLAPQDASLVAGTVRDNLLLAASDANEANLWAALHVAALDERVAKLPGGLDCWIGEAGMRLSGGERRRLCLARALLRPSPWLLLDEPTEGLDAATEHTVVTRLREWLEERRQGAIIISHRAPTLAICDRVVQWRTQAGAAMRIGSV